MIFRKYKQITSRYHNSYKNQINNNVRLLRNKYTNNLLHCKNLRSVVYESEIIHEEF